MAACAGVVLPACLRLTGTALPEWPLMKRPTPRFKWKPSQSSKLSFSFGELATIVAVLVAVLGCLVLSVAYPPPTIRSSFGPDWDCAPIPYATVCQKQIDPA